VLIEVETEIKKYLKLNNALHFLELQDLRAGFLRSLCYRIVQQSCFFKLLLFRYVLYYCSVMSFPGGNCPAVPR